MTVTPQRRVAGALTALLLGALVATGCGSSSSDAPEGGAGANGDAANTPGTTTPAEAPSGSARSAVTVDIRSFKYKPPTIVVKKGGRVKWTNSDAAAHTATADDRSFDTQTIDKGRAKTVTMTTRGTFKYHCDFHPFMKGTIVVK